MYVTNHQEEEGDLQEGAELREVVVEGAELRGVVVEGAELQGVRGAEEEEGVVHRRGVQEGEGGLLRLLQMTEPVGL